MKRIVDVLTAVRHVLVVLVRVQPDSVGAVVVGEVRLFSGVLIDQFALLIEHALHLTAAHIGQADLLTERLLQVELSAALQLRP